ncbi:hypothetical protein EIP91_009062 [Steccherinum ochraceum]|uniref:ABM domain-containing protein n=1 Tax=Steccherinum ochraceum TaxID=92696 RepID=A0A4R0RBX8_9APHY|nr:hypothetical protein EIP91_009062 [Steccherinum ochraceum]
MTGHTVIEIARFEGNQDYAKNPHIIDEAFAIVAKTKGCNAIWHGLQEEENTVWLVLWWESVEAHLALVHDKPVYDVLGDLFAKCGSRKHYMLHTPFTSSPVEYLQAPVTEVTWIHLKSPNKDVEQHLAKGKGFSWGKTVEKDDVYVLITGAQKVETGNLSQNPAVKGIHGHISEVKPCHIKLHNYKPPRTD